MEIQCLFASIFNCENKTENLSNATHLRIQSIMAASNQRKDHIHKILAEKLSRNAEVVFHKFCVSTYTSKHHISRILGKRINTARSKKWNLHHPKGVLRPLPSALKNTVSFVEIYVFSVTPNILIVDVRYVSVKLLTLLQVEKAQKNRF